LIHFPPLEQHQRWTILGQFFGGGTSSTSTQTWWDQGADPWHGTCRGAGWQGETSDLKRKKWVGGEETEEWWNDVEWLGENFEISSCLMVGMQYDNMIYV